MFGFRGSGCRSELRVSSVLFIAGSIFIPDHLPCLPQSLVTVGSFLQGKIVFPPAMYSFDPPRSIPFAVPVVYQLFLSLFGPAVVIGGPVVT